MRVAVISDVHSNLPALEAVLEALRPFDAVWQIGDVVGYGPRPAEVIERLVALTPLGVLGNHDAAATEIIPTDWFNDDARAAIEWTSELLTPASRAWLAAQPERGRSGDFTLVHGSPREPIWEYVLSVASARANLAAFETRYCIVGHSHIPLVFREDGDRIETILPEDGATIELDERRAIINPGSVGQPRDGDTRASCVLLDTEAHVLTWKRVEYPIGEVQAAMREARLPRRLVERLTFGR